MRHTVFRLAKEKHGYTFTRDGYVISKVKGVDGKEEHIYMTTPEDLFHVGYSETEVDWKREFGFEI